MSTQKKVKVFSTPTCPYCHMAKDYLKDKKVEFEDIDVSSDQKLSLCRWLRNQVKWAFLNYGLMMKW